MGVAVASTVAPIIFAHVGKSVVSLRAGWNVPGPITSGASSPALRVDLPVGKALSAASQEDAYRVVGTNDTPPEFEKVRHFFGPLHAKKN